MFKRFKSIIKTKKNILEINQKKREELSKNIKTIKETLKYRFTKKAIDYTHILAREILITETFINRLIKETGRPVVVIGNGGTGKPYTWSIKEKKGLIVKNFNYPSSNIGYLNINKIKSILQKMVEKTNKKYKNNNKKPLFVFIDASKEPRMPASFLGNNKDSGSISNKHSLIKLFEDEKAVLVGYDWSLNNNQTKLPKVNQEIKDSNVILFNPVGISERSREYSAFHDDKTHLLTDSNFKKLTLTIVDLLKMRLFKD
jgi:hypothetical protein